MKSNFCSRDEAAGDVADETQGPEEAGRIAVAEPRDRLDRAQDHHEGEAEGAGHDEEGGPSPLVEDGFSVGGLPGDPGLGNCVVRCPGLVHDVRGVVGGLALRRGDGVVGTRGRPQGLSRDY